MAALTAPWWLPNLPWSKQWLASRIGQRFGLECRLGRIVPVAWDGRAHLHGLRLVRPGTPEPLVDLPHLTAHVRWSALGRGRLEITRLDIDHGRIHWSAAPTPADDPLEGDPATTTDPATPTAAANDLAAANPDPSQTSHAATSTVPGAGGLLGPVTTVADAELEGASASVSTDPTAAAPETDGAIASAITPQADAPESASRTTAGAPQPPSAQPAPAPVARPQRRWKLERLHISNLHLRWQRTGAVDATEVASATVDLDIPLVETPAEADRRGHIQCRDVRLIDRAWPGAIDIPVTWDGVALRAREVDVPMPGGTAHISWEMAPAAPGLPLAGAVLCRGARLDDISRWLAPEAVPAIGVVEAEMRFAVPVRHPSLLRTVAQGRLIGLVVPMTAWLEQAGLPGIAARWPAPQWPARAATAQFSTTGGLITLEDATLSAEELTVRALGTASSSGGPSLAVRAYVPPGGADLLTRLSATWPPDRRLAPQPLPNSPWAFLDIGIQGSWAHPEFVLWDQAWLLPDLRSEIRRLQGPTPPS